MKPSAASLVGIGWRPRHAVALLTQRPNLGFIEVHSENFFADGGPARHSLLRARAEWPVSLHGVGLALGSAAGLDAWHLAQLAQLVTDVDPVRVSDHASFARVRHLDGTVRHAADLLPVSFNRATLHLMGAHVQQVQERLSRRLWVENLSACLRSEADDIPEPEFFNALVRETGCGLLLDVNNLVVNAKNAGATDPVAVACAWVDALTPGIVGEIHLAGHDDRSPLVIDDHGSPVPEDVWRVYAHALARLGPVPSLIEWDTRVPPLGVLLAQAELAAGYLATALIEPEVLRPAPGVVAVPPVGVTSLAPESVWATEETRQRSLVDAIFEAPTGLRGGQAAGCSGWLGLSGVSRTASAQAAWAEGVEAYRRNGQASACRALAQAYPVLGLCLGRQAVVALAHALWQQRPPAQGDLNRWGGALAELLTQLEDATDWPWLPDLARLEWALHQAGGAADAPTQPANLALAALAEADLGEVSLHLRPGTQVLRSDWPVLSLWRLHQPVLAIAAALPEAEEAQPEASELLSQAESDALTQAMSGLLDTPQPECMVVWRDLHAVRADALNPNEAEFTLAIQARCMLEPALQNHAGLDFSAWLTRAWQQGWLLCATHRPQGADALGLSSTASLPPPAVDKV